MSAMKGAHISGFADPVAQSQTCFRTLLDCFAHPARPRRLDVQAPAWGALSPGAVAILLTLADQETPVWFDASLTEDEQLRELAAFHCGVRAASRPVDAAFAFVSAPSGLFPLARFAQGDADFPDRSSTIIVLAEEFLDGPFVFMGPGLREPRGFGVAGLGEGFAAEWRANRTRFPLGCDIVFVSEREVAALPRSLRLVEA